MAEGGSRPSPGRQGKTGERSKAADQATREGGFADRPEVAPRGQEAQADWGAPSSRNELVPLLNHVGVLVHDGVPAGDAAHAFLVAAAVAHATGFLQHVAVGR